MYNNLSDLKNRIKQKNSHLTESQKAIANYIIENPQIFALSSIREIEKESNISKSTIVRLAQTLDYSGFHEMRLAFENEIRKNLEPIRRYKKFLADTARSSSSSKLDYIQLISDETVHNIHKTMQLVDTGQYRRALELLKNACHVYTMGLAMSSHLAEIASYLFNRVCIKSYFISYGSITFKEQIINLSKKDLVFAFSFPPYSKETIEAARYARERQIKIIVVTDKMTNKIVDYSDVFLQVSVESMAISNSIMSVLVLLYAMVTQISHAKKSKIMETIEAIEDVRKKCT